MVKFEEFFKPFLTFLITLSAEVSCIDYSISNCSCGYQNLPGSRIFGGVAAKREEEFPWQVALIYKENRKFACGGSIINNMYILTAAHCFNRISRGKMRITSTKELVILFGSHDLSKLISLYEEGETRYFRNPKYVILHQFYSPINFHNDIALIRVIEVFTEYSLNVHPICLPPIGPSFENADTIVSGWGSVIHLTPNVYILRKTNIKVLPGRECKKGFPNSFKAELMICAASPGHDACGGDSGGALIKQLRIFKYIQIGIVSFGRGCGDKNYPGVYSRLNRYIKWIIRHTKDATYCSN